MWPKEKCNLFRSSGALIECQYTRNETSTSSDYSDLLSRDLYQSASALISRVSRRVPLSGLINPRRY